MPEFTIERCSNMDLDLPDIDPTPPKPPSPEQSARLELLMKRILPVEKKRELENVLLQRLKENKAALQKMLQIMGDHWTYEDHVYRFYHGSWKVYSTQQTTEKAVELLRKLLPERELNPMFEDILKEGIGKNFEFEHNNEWEKHTRPILEAFFHTKFMIEMAVRYADAPEPTTMIRSGYAALLYLYDLR